MTLKQKELLARLVAGLEEYNTRERLRFAQRERAILALEEANRLAQPVTAAGGGAGEGGGNGNGPPGGGG